MTPTKRVSFIEIPKVVQDVSIKPDSSKDGEKSSTSRDKLNSSEQDVDTSISDKTIHLKMCTEIEAVESPWPDALKCKHYDV